MRGIWQASLVFVGFGAGALLGTLARPPANATFPSYADAFDALAPSVVNVTAAGEGSDLEAENRVGSGFAISTGEVVTARHLVVGAALVEVKGIDGVPRAARVVGMDARTDLALLSVEGATLPAVEWGTTDGLRVGDTVLAIGNPYGLSHSLAVGVVGQRARRLSPSDDGPRVDFLQLSVPLNPGNSGGPVFDAGGRVVGVLTGTHAQGQAIAFAVPVEVVTADLPALRRGENISRAFLGLRVEATERGVEVVSVVASGPADLAGVRPGDVVTAFAGQPVGVVDDLYRRLDDASGGSMAELALTREGSALSVSVQLADWAEQPVVVAGMILRPRAGTGGEVVAVRADSRAAAAGVHDGDQVRAVDGVPVQAPAAVKARLADAETAQLEVWRDGTLVTLRL